MTPQQREWIDSLATQLSENPEWGITRLAMTKNLHHNVMRMIACSTTDDPDELRELAQAALNASF